MRKADYFFAAAAALALLLGMALFLRLTKDTARPPPPSKAGPAVNPAVQKLIGQTRADLNRLTANYKIAPYVQAAADLQALPRGEAVSLLKNFAVTKDSAKTKFLCLLLFDLRNIPNAGHPFAGRAWQVYLEDVPFILIRPDDSAPGKLPDGRTFLNLCLTKGKWSERHYAPLTPEQLRQAIDKLLGLTVFANPLSEEEKTILYYQADLTPGG